MLTPFPSKKTSGYAGNTLFTATITSMQYASAIVQMATLRIASREKKKRKKEV